MSAYSPPHYTHKTSTRERILDVAEAIFARYGYLAATVDDIATAVGIKRPSLFHHFRNKQTLYTAVLDRAITHEANYFDKAFAKAPPANHEAELERLTDATFDFLVDHPNFTYLVLHTLAANRVDETPTRIATQTLERWHAALERGRAAQVFRDISVAECMALIGGMTSFYVAMPGSQTASLKAIGGLDRGQLQQELRRLVRALVLDAAKNNDE